MNADALVAALRLKIGVREGDGLYTDAVCIDLIDEANAMVEAEKDWPWRRASVAFQTVAGQALYDEDSIVTAGDIYTEDYTEDYGYLEGGGWLRTLSLQVIGYEPMIERQPVDLHSRNPADERGLPVEYAVDGSIIVLSPTPDQAYAVRHRYVTLNPRLADGDAIPVMPEMFQRVIVAQAAALAFTRQGQDTRAQAQELAVERWRQRMADEARRSRGPIRTRVRA